MTLFARDTLTKPFHVDPCGHRPALYSNSIRIAASNTSDSAAGKRSYTYAAIRSWRTRAHGPATYRTLAIPAMRPYRTYTHAGRASCSAMHHETRALHTCSPDAQDAMSGRTIASFHMQPPWYPACTRAASFHVKSNDQHRGLHGILRGWGWVFIAKCVVTLRGISEVKLYFVSCWSVCYNFFGIIAVCNEEHNCNAKLWII